MVTKECEWLPDFENERCSPTDNFSFAKRKKKNRKSHNRDWSQIDRARESNAEDILKE